MAQIENADPTAPVFHARALRKIYGAGEAEVCALDGITLTCNRFDLDWELLIKLIRAGHRPIEIPISYNSRSFKEGKKIRMFRDPLTWLVAWAKSRFGPL